MTYNDAEIMAWLKEHRGRYDDVDQEERWAYQAVDNLIDEYEHSLSHGLPLVPPKKQKQQISSAQYSLYRHLTSRHACQFDHVPALEVLQSLHEHEHRGPGTIRNHEFTDWSVKPDDWQAGDMCGFCGSNSTVIYDGTPHCLSCNRWDDDE